MTTYPYLPDLGECDALGIVEDFLDPTIASPMENGLVITRPRYKRVRRTYQVPYKLASQAAADALREFVRNTVVGGSGMWLWVDPRSGEEIKVRFVKDKLPKIAETGVAENAIVYGWTLELEEA